MILVLHRYRNVHRHEPLSTPPGHIISLMWDYMHLPCWRTFSCLTMLWIEKRKEILDEGRPSGSSEGFWLFLAHFVFPRMCSDYSSKSCACFKVRHRCNSFLYVYQHLIFLDISFPLGYLKLHCIVHVQGLSTIFLMRMFSIPIFSVTSGRSLYTSRHYLCIYVHFCFPLSEVRLT